MVNTHTVTAAVTAAPALFATAVEAKWSLSRVKQTWTNVAESAFRFSVFVHGKERFPIDKLTVL